MSKQISRKRTTVDREYEAHVANVEAFVGLLRGPYSGVGEHLEQPDLVAIVSNGLFWLSPEAVDDDCGALDQQSDDHALLAFPSSHSCLVANVVAPLSVLAQGCASRFVKRGGIPPAYLACECNFDRDDGTGEVFSVEISLDEHQELSREEARTFPEVEFCLDPHFRSQWRSYFCHNFTLKELYEVWDGDNFVCNQPEPLGPGSRKGLSAFRVYTLWRSSFDSFEVDVRRAIPASAGRPSSFGGCAVVFRQAGPEHEPFGMWLLWLVVQGRFLIVDVQNKLIEPNLRVLVDALSWDSPARPEVFFAMWSPAVMSKVPTGKKGRV